MVYKIAAAARARRRFYGTLSYSMPTIYGDDAARSLHAAPRRRLLLFPPVIAHAARGAARQR